jgi:hypothetical protein
MVGATPVLVHNARPPRQTHDVNATGPQTTFMYGGDGEIKKYAEWGPPSDARDPRPFVLRKRFDRYSPPHTNLDGAVIKTPHMNMPDGTARELKPGEMPGGC